MTDITINAYENKASSYDRYSSVTMGDRLRQRHYLSDLLSLHESRCGAFLDLGCGTGFFTEALFEWAPDAVGYMVDGSQQMLALGRERLAENGWSIEGHNCLFSEFDWDVAPEFDVVFSGFALHHLPDREKRLTIEAAGGGLRPGGALVIFDNFLPRESGGRSLIEFITCMDIMRRARPLGTSIEEVIKKDRRLKQLEGDQEATFEDCIDWMRDSGLKDVTPIFLEGRYGGVAGYRA